MTGETNADTELEDTEIVEPLVVAPAGAPAEAQPDPQAQPTRYQRRIDQLTARAKGSEEESHRLRQQLELERQQNRQGTPSQARTQPQQFTPQDIELAYTKGQITDSDRIQYHAELRARALLEEDRRTRQMDDAVSSASREIDEYKVMVPDLVRDGSATRLEVQRVYNDMLTQGAPRDVRTELWALRQVLGLKEKLGRARTVDEHSRMAAPIGTAYPGSSGSSSSPRSVQAKTRGEALFNRLTDEAVGFYRGMGMGDEDIKADLEFANEDLLARRGRLK